MKVFGHAVSRPLIFLGFYYILPPPKKIFIHRSESDHLKMHALLNWAIALSDVRTLFLDNSLIALHSFSFAQKIKDHSSLLSVRSIHKSDVPSTVKCIWRMRGKNLCVHGEDAKRILAYYPNTLKDIKVCTRYIPVNNNTNFKIFWILSI